MNKVIDFRVRPPLPESMQQLEELPEFEHYRKLYQRSSRLGKIDFECGWEALLSEMDEAGVEKALLVAEDMHLTMGRKVSNDIIAAGVRRHPNRFLGLASVDPNDRSKAVSELERAVKELGLVGLTLWPPFHKLPANHRLYYPLYEKALELGIFVVLHTSVNFSRSSPLEVSRPFYLDGVAVDFPELRLVASHAGWPWVTELMAVAWRHPNVFMEISAMRPKYMTRSGSGWEPLLNYGNTILQDRVMFATSWPLLPLKRTVDEVRNFPLEDPVKEKWLYRNAAGFLGLDD
jgi:predicted TIM-barrel fold metal-dependent hydrolase